MKLKVYGDKSEDELYLKLEKDFGGVTVKAVDKGGDAIPNGNLVRFQENGKLHLCNGVRGDLGFRLDMDDRIVVD